MRGPIQSLHELTTIIPPWQPPADYGLQFVAFGEGGPSGNPAYKASTIIPHPGMHTMTILPSILAGPYRFLFGMIAPPQGIPMNRPVAPFNNSLAMAQNYGIIAGLSKPAS